jgi:hypothetical protein
MVRKYNLDSNIRLDSGSNLPPLFNPAFKYNYHDRSKGLKHEINSKSYEVAPGRLRNKSHLDDIPALAQPLRIRDRYEEFVIAVPRCVNMEGIPQDLTLQEKIRLINEKNNDPKRPNKPGVSLLPPVFFSNKLPGEFDDHRKKNKKLPIILSNNR